MHETEERFLRFVRPLQRRLHFVGRQYVTHTQDVHDLVQEVLLRAWRAYSPTLEREFTPAWLFVIMRNVAIDWQRSSGRRIKLVPIADGELTELSAADPGEPFAEFPAMDESRFREFLDDRVAAALDELNPTFREVLVLSVAGDLSYREIAEVLGRPIGTVMSSMARARRALREKLVSFCTTESPVREHQS